MPLADFVLLSVLVLSTRKGINCKRELRDEKKSKMTHVPGGIKTAMELFSLFNEMEQHKDAVNV